MKKNNPKSEKKVFSSQTVKKGLVWHLKKRSRKSMTTPHPSLLRRGIGRLRGKSPRFHLAALAGVIVIVIVIVSFSLLPEKARSKTFTFFQTVYRFSAGMEAIDKINGFAIIKSVNPPRAYFL